MDAVQIRSVEDWERQISDSFFPLRVQAAPDRFSATIATVDLPRSTRFASVHVEGTHLARTDRLIRSGAADHALMLFQLTGKGILRQGDRQALLQDGSAALIDPTLPYEVKFTEDSDQLVILVPTAALRAAGTDLERVRARVLPGGSVAIRGLTLLGHELTAATAIAPGEAEGLSSAIVDMIRGAASSVLAEGMLGSAMAHEAQRRLAIEFVEQHLADPNLGVDAVARAVGISPRQLAIVFGPDDSPGAFIRRRRLARIYDELTSPARMLEPAHEIAARWGVTNYSSFARTFHRELGMTPTDARTRARDAIG
jgi:AraC-like DNA-binding protein